MEVSPAAQLQRLLRLSRSAESRFGRDGRLSWRIWGAGEPLVLLHGGYGSWRHWARNIEALGRHHQLWVPDLPGLGASSPPPDGSGPEAIADLVLDGLRALGAPSPRAVAGFSFGSIIAGYLASRVPIASLVLIGPSGLGVERADVPLEKVPARASSDQLAAVHRRNLAALMLSDPDKIDALAVAIQTANVSEARFKSLRFSRADTLITALERSRATHIAAIWGADDAVAQGTLAQRRSVLEAMPRFRGAELIAGAGHWVMYEAPSQFDAALLKQFRP
jgi:pimeloyl-ACP methyl ester carboxylesterase